MIDLAQLGIIPGAASNISALGVKAYLVASKTFPVGILLTHFPDDQEGIVLPTIAVSESKMDLNGKMITNNQSNPIEVIINTVPHSIEDQALGTLVLANRSSSFKASVRDSCTLVIRWPGGTVSTFTNGAINSGKLDTNAHHSGRMTTTSYQFSFHDVYRANVVSAISTIFNTARSALGF